MTVKKSAKTKKGIAASDNTSKKKSMLDALIRENKILTTINNIAIDIGRPLHLEELLNTAQEEILNLLKINKSILIY